MSEAVEFIHQHSGHPRAIMLYFHNLLTGELDLEAKIRFKIPFYFRKSWICYLNPAGEGVEFAFTRGNELSNAQGLLQSKGRKQVYSVTFQKLSDIPRAEILEVIHEALLLDEIKPYGSKRSRRKSR